MSYKAVPRWKQQLGGVLLLFIGGGITAWEWHTALNEGYYSKKWCVLFPAVAVVGLGLMAFPGYTEERIARGEDVSGLSGFQLLTPRWWAIVVVALLAGIFNFWMLLSIM